MEFSHKSIEQKWQKYWEEQQTFLTTNNNEKKAYILDMFPYPSGAGLHVGHPKGYTATDVISRMRKMQDYDVLHPIGWDAFGLPAEQYALQTGNSPIDFTEKNIFNFRKQLQSLGFSYDYQKEINTSYPEYYKTTQWIFSQLYKHGLAERKEVDVNWCPDLGTVLANEEVLVIDGKMVSERGHFPVYKKPMLQWILKITKYAERLLAGLDELDWPHSVKELQRNWIGKSIGTNIEFEVLNSTEKIKVFTTRAETIFGVEYLVLAPEHFLVEKLVHKDYKSQLQEYLTFVASKTDIDRQDNTLSKTGMFLGSYALNPVNKKKIPIWIADYVLPNYGLGAVMAVPGHDARDFSFAKKYQLPISYIIDTQNYDKPMLLKDGILINSNFLDGLSITKAREKIDHWLNENKIGEKTVNYKLRDWLFSRQRYWGEPFPIIFWEDGSISLVDKNDLPLELPKIEKISISKTGESPLANVSQWLNVVDSNGNKGRRETNTMPQWAGSCWYYLAYILKQPNSNELIAINSDEAKKLFAKWLPVDLYIGGQEHAVLHLLYARFWHQFLYDIKIVPTPEPFMKLVNQGMILGPDGTKMSKSKGNVINPDDIIKSHGADTLRLYEMFMGPLEASLPWSFEGLDSMRKWLDRVFRLVKANRFTKINNHILDFSYHNMVKRTSNLLEELKFNNAISELMVFINACYKTSEPIFLDYFAGFTQILSCFTPHIAEEIWFLLGNTSSVAHSKWPKFEEKFLVSDDVTIIVQFNGKLKFKLNLSKNLSSEALLGEVKNNLQINEALKHWEIVKEIVVPNRIVNFVGKEK